MSNTEKPTCPKHKGVVLVCRRCESARGGQTTDQRYSSDQKAEWGKKGGRPKKPKKPVQTVWPKANQK